jgi:chromosome segregation ATPase
LQAPHRINDMRLKLLALSLLVAVAALAGTPDRFAYIYKRGDDTMMRINGSLEAYQRIARRWSGEYIWVNRNGRQYLIRDVAVLAAARGAFAEMEKFEPSLRAAEEKLRPIEKRHDAIEDRIEALEDDDSLEAQLRAAERQLRAMEGQLQAAEREVERMDREMERLEEIAEKKFEAIVLRAIDAGKAQRVD